MPGNVLEAHKIAADTATAASRESRAALRAQIATAYDMGDLELLVTDLADQWVKIDWEDIKRDRKNGTILALVQWCEKYQEVRRLLHILQQQRPVQFDRFLTNQR